MTDKTEDLSKSDAAYVAFVEQSWQRHLRLAMLLTRDRSQAEELLQDSLVKMYERWRKLSQREDLHAYLRRVLVNSQTSIWRRRRRESLVAQVPDHADQSPGTHPDRQALLTAVRTLPARQRAVIALRHYEDLSEREVAQILGCSLGTVKSQHAKALGKLRHLIAKPPLEHAHPTSASSPTNGSR